MIKDCITELEILDIVSKKDYEITAKLHYTVIVNCGSTGIVDIIIAPDHVEGSAIDEDGNEIDLKGFEIVNAYQFDLITPEPNICSINFRTKTVRLI